MTDISLLEVFQICDSTFPVGTFNHSYGMENFLYERKIKNASDVRTWLKDYYSTQFSYGEGLAVLLTYDALHEKRFNDILVIDELLTTSMSAHDTRKGSILIASQMIQLLKRIYGDDIPYLGEYEKCIVADEAYGNPAIVFAMQTHKKKIDKQSAYLMYGYNVGSTLIQNAVRAVPLGQKDGQVILHDLICYLPELLKKSEQLSADDIGASAPGLEIAQICHETQPARLFMS
jgi:urease accessory protein